MKKLILGIFLILLFSLPGMAQCPLSGTGSPSGTCATNSTYFQTDATVGNNFWFYNSGWHQLAIVNGVSSVTGGTALSCAPTTGSVTCNSTGVTSTTAGTGISINQSTGAVTVTNSGAQSVTGGTGVVCTPSTGAITCSIAQSVATSVTPTFAGVTTSAGASTSNMLTMGFVSVSVSASGVVNGGDATDDNLFSYSLPANSLSSAGKTVNFFVSGTTANNADTKTIKLWVGGATVLTKAITGALQDWSAYVTATRNDPAHLNVWAGFFGGSGTATVTNTKNLSVSDVTANQIILQITGASGSSASGDAIGYGMKVEFGN